MRSITRVLALSAAMCAAAAVPGHAQSVIGTAVSVDDTVTGRGARKISNNSNIFANESIRANATGLGHFQFTDGTKIVVGPNARIVLDDLVFNPGSSTFRKFAINTGNGAIRFISGNSASRAYEIKTPTATLGIRGTAFDLTQIGNRAYLMMVNGAVEICSAGTCETVQRRCDFVVVNANGSISPPTQPRNGIFGASDMRRYFPFINDQSRIAQGFRLRVGACGGGASAGAPGGGNDANRDRDLDRGRGGYD